VDRTWSSTTARPVAAFAASPDELEVAFAGDADVAGVVELYVRPIDANGPAARVSHELTNVDAGSAVSEFRTARSYAVYLSDADASGSAGVFSAPLRYSTPPLRISDPRVDALGGLVLADDVGRALFRGAFVNREWLFSAPVDGRGRLIALNYDPPIDGRITSVVLGPGGEFAVFLGDQEVDEVFELYVAATDAQGLPIQLSAPLVAGGDVLPASRSRRTARAWSTSRIRTWTTSSSSTSPTGARP
jgi:hypothetical protein